VPCRRKITKTSRAAERVVAYEYRTDALTTVAELKQLGYTAIALEVTPESIDLGSLDYSALNKICLVLGAENAGVNPALLECCAYTVHIPMRGHQSSMNVATACAIALYEMTKGLVPNGGDVASGAKEHHALSLTRSHSFLPWSTP
jgi:tRNA G18 (ribose-2'-O)-methylase SpoU